MQGIWQDLRYGARGIRKQPGFAALAALTLALGIGAATTIFSVIQGVLLDPFPYLDSRRVVQIQIRDLENPRPGGRTVFQVAEYLAYQEQVHAFEEVIGGTVDDVLETTTEGTERYSGGGLTPNAFRFLGVPPLLGRGLTPDDARPGAPPVFVMAHKLWVARFNRDRSIVGRTFVLNGQATTLVGIMPPRFTKLAGDLWRPLALDRIDPTSNQRYILLQARLRPGVTLAQASAEIDVVARRLARLYPKEYPKQLAATAVPWVDSVVGRFRTTLYTLAAAVALLLLIACNNVANMLLARAAAREKEMAVRASLGARRSRLIQQLLIESLLLALGGAALGCALAWIGLKALVPLIPDGLIPREAVIQISVPVLLFSLGAAVATALLFGLVPALLTAKRNIAGALKDSGKGVTGGFRRGRLRRVLVVGEVALSLILLAGAGLLMRSFVKLQQVDLGLDPANILVARLPLPQSTYKTAADKQRFFGQLLGRLEGLPGVVAATETSTLPPYGGIGSELEIPGKPHAERWDAIFQLCSEGYFRTLGVRQLRGRTLSAVEVSGARKVAVVNQTLVSRYFGQEDPLGRRIKLAFLETPVAGKVADPSFEIVGVISDVKNRGIQEPPQPEIFIPYTLTGAFERGILVRTAGDPRAMLSTVRREIWAVDRSVALANTGTLTDFLKQFSYAEPRFSLILLGIFAGAGLLLVAVGVYSVIAYTVSRQTQEIGVRMALGAGRRDVMRLVLRMGFRLVGLGMLIGVAASLAAGRVLASQLWGVSAHDPAALVAVLLVMALASAAACVVPARRAVKVDPIVALRSE
jgi:putative ABC transport system permease protein